MGAWDSISVEEKSNVHVSAPANAYDYGDTNGSVVRWRGERSVWAGDQFAISVKQKLDTL